MLIRIVASAGMVKLTTVVMSPNDILHCRLSATENYNKILLLLYDIPRADAASEEPLRGKMIFHRFWLHNSLSSRPANQTCAAKSQVRT